MSEVQYDVQTSGGAAAAAAAQKEGKTEDVKMEEGTEMQNGASEAAEQEPPAKKAKTEVHSALWSSLLEL